MSPARDALEAAPPGLTAQPSVAPVPGPRPSSKKDRVAAAWDAGTRTYDGLCAAAETTRASLSVYLTQPRGRQDQRRGGTQKEGGGVRPGKVPTRPRKRHIATPRTDAETPDYRTEDADPGDGGRADLPDLPHDPIQHSRRRALWLAVIQQGASDAAGVTFMGKRAKGAHEHAVAQGKAWMRGGRDSDEVCRLADLDPAWALRKMAEKARAAEAGEGRVTRGHLTPAQKVRIDSLLLEGAMTGGAIARLFGCTGTVVSNRRAKLRRAGCDVGGQLRSGLA